MPAAPLAKAHLAQYTIRTSDVLAEMRVNVLEEGTDNVLWFKERVMTDDEIVESVVDSATTSLRWSIHRPIRGWYLRIRSPSFSPGTFIPLIPPAPAPTPTPASPPASTPPTITTTTTPEHPDSALTFSVRTATPTPAKAPPGEVHIDINVHSYPPTPPVAPSSSSSSSQTLSIPSPRDINAKLKAIASPNPSPVTRFLLYPSLPLPPSTTTASLSPFSRFSRALSYITPSLPIRATASFTLAPALSRAGDIVMPLLTFTDRTPTFSVLTTGLLEVNKGLERQLGVDPAFWVTVALAYLEYLTERDVRKAYHVEIRLTRDDDSRILLPRMVDTFYMIDGSGGGVDVLAIKVIKPRFLYHIDPCSYEPTRLLGHWLSLEGGVACSGAEVFCP